MRKIRFASLTVLLTLALAARPAQAVVRGEVDSENKLPNVGSFVVVSQLGEPFGPFIHITGTLIHPRVVLTSGHGIVDAAMLIEAGLFDISDARWSFGVDAFDPDTWLEIEAIIPHPAIIPGRPAPTQIDVGIVILKDPVQGIEPVELAPVGFLDALKNQGALREGGGTEFTVAGYGMQIVFPPTQEIPEDGLRRFAQAVYGGITELWLTLLQNPVAHEGGIWKGDSGGPAFWIDPDSHERVQVAVTQWANPQAWSRFARIDVPEVSEWIGAVIAAVEAEEEN